MTFSSTVVLPVTERMHTADGMLSDTQPPEETRRTGPWLGLGPQGTLQISFWAKNPAPGVQVPARPP